MRNNIKSDIWSFHNKFRFDKKIILLLIRVSIKFNTKLVNYSRRPLFLDLLSVLTKKILFSLAVKSFKDTFITLKIRNCSSLFLKHNSLLVFNSIILKLLKNFYDVLGFSSYEEKKFLILFQNESLYKLCAFEFRDLTEIVFTFIIFGEIHDKDYSGKVCSNELNFRCLENFLIRVCDCVVYFSIKYNYNSSILYALRGHSWIKSFKDKQRLFIYLLLSSYFHSIIDTTQKLNNSIFRGWIVRGTYIDSISFEQFSLTSLKKLPKISLLVFLLINVIDTVIPQFNLFILFLRKAITFIFSDLIIKTNLL
uniref:Uncharacterized protein ycf55 n=1 Tax=Cyanidium caldarium TaxID=2771 RepID=YCF55_CYACA|nr:hypothetical protein JXY51_pgp161 [Cyanidium caldarium]O19888.1 RecName: Full=Uncharacterized protein ycf55 [Cyanidium caldarium]AAB82701.1 unknown [Cyanidium caldarium]